MMKFQRAILSLTCVFLLTCGGMHALAAKNAPTESQVKGWITKNTGIKACGNPKYNFTQVQFGEPVRRTIEYSQKPVQLYPVYAAYSVDCMYGDEEMHVDVDMTFGIYKDAFGNWKNFGPEFDADQKWADIQNDLRCRAQDLAASRTPAKDKTYIGCTVIAEEN